MDTEHEELEALARELVREEGMPLDVARDVAALLLDEAAAVAADWDQAAKRARDAELLAFAQAWDAQTARLRALVS